MIKYSKRIKIIQIIPGNELNRNKVCIKSEYQSTSLNIINELC